MERVRMRRKKEEERKLVAASTQSKVTENGTIKGHVEKEGTPPMPISQAVSKREGGTGGRRDRTEGVSGGVASPKEIQDEREGVRSPASDGNETNSSSSHSSSFMTHSTHTAVPSPGRLRTPGPMSVVEASESDDTETRTVRGGTMERSSTRSKRQMVGSLHRWLLGLRYRIGVWRVVGMIIAVMGVYYQLRTGRMKRGKREGGSNERMGWIKRSFFDFWRMALQGISL